MVLTIFSSFLKPYLTQNRTLKIVPMWLPGSVNQLLTFLDFKESHGIFMKEGPRAYFMSINLILSNLWYRAINVYFSFSLCKTKLLLFAAPYITWKYLINDMFEHFQEDGINKRAKFQEIYIEHKAELREGKTSRTAEKPWLKI